MKLKQLWLAIAVAASMQAAVVTFNPAEESGGQSVDLEVIFDDSSNAGFITGTVNVLPGGADGDLGDIRGVYFDLVNLPMGVTAADVLAAISGPDITGTVLNGQLSGDASINPLGPFDIGLEIGGPGIGGGDDFLSTTFLINLGLISPDITLANFGAVGVRVTSIGTGDDREGSGKFIDTTPDDGGGGPSEVPEPGTYALAVSAFTAMVAYRRFGRK